MSDDEGFCPQSGRCMPRRSQGAVVGPDHQRLARQRPPPIGTARPQRKSQAHQSIHWIGTIS